MKFRKKPLVVEAVQWTGKNVEEIILFVPEEGFHLIFGEKVEISSLEGILTASNGDWIIKGIKGEFYPCKPDTFEATYEVVAEEALPKLI